MLLCPVEVHHCFNGKQSLACHMLLAGYLLGSLLNCEDWGSAFLWNVSEHYQTKWHHFPGHLFYGHCCGTSNPTWWYTSPHVWLLNINHKNSVFICLPRCIYLKIFVMEVYCYYVYNILAPKQHPIVVIYNAPKYSKWHVVIVDNYDEDSVYLL
jgi:hypothetical protein